MIEFKIKSINNPDKTQQVELALSGDLNIVNVAQLKDLILDKFKTNHQLEIDLSQITAVDFSLFQLLCSAHRYAEKHDKRFKLNENVTDEFIAKGQGLGFFQHSACKDVTTPEHCLWIDKNFPHRQH